MTEHERGLAGGSTASGGMGGGAGAGRDNGGEAAFWVSHRQGPFLIHDNSGECEPQPNDNAGYLDDKEAGIEQGFAPCPKCLA